MESASVAARSVKLDSRTLLTVLTMFVNRDARTHTARTGVQTGNKQSLYTRGVDAYNELIYSLQCKFRATCIYSARISMQRYKTIADNITTNYTASLEHLNTENTLQPR